MRGGGAALTAGSQACGPLLAMGCEAPRSGMGLLTCPLWSLSSATASGTGLCKDGHSASSGGEQRGMDAGVHSLLFI